MATERAAGATKGHWVTVETGWAYPGAEPTIEVRWDGRKIAVVYGASVEEVRANAALIARAPDLLAEAERLRTENDNSAADSVGKCDFPPGCRAPVLLAKIGRLRRIVAEAERTAQRRAEESALAKKDRVKWGG